MPTGALFFVEVAGKSQRLTGTPEDERAPSPGREGRSVFYASLRDGQWSVYRRALASGEGTLVVTDAYRAVETRDGAVYFTRPARPGVWRLGGSSQELAVRVSADPPPELWNAWQVVDHRLWVVRRTPGWDFHLDRIDLATGALETVASFDELFDDAGLSVSADGKTVLFASIDRSESDLWLLELGDVE